MDAGKRLQERLNRLIKRTEEIKETRRGFHPEKGLLQPVVEYQAILREIKDDLDIPTDDLPEIDRAAPPKDEEYDALCEQRCIEVNRQSKILLEKVSDFVTLQKCIMKAEKRLHGAAENLSNAKSAVENREYHNAILQSQLCIEHSTKALFDLVDLPPPRLHEIPIDSWDLIVKSMIGKKTPPLHTMEEVIKKLNGLTEYQKKSLARVSWLNSTWSRLHTIATYGHLEVQPSDLFGKEDAEIAIKYGNESYLKVSEIINDVKFRKIEVKI